jgi:AraC-like DNA-binding protein
MNHTRHATNRILLRARDTMDRDYAAPLDVGFASLGTSSRTFREVLGTSPRAYRERVRDQPQALVPGCLAKNWNRPSHPVADIFKRVGLRSVDSFTTSCGRAYRLSPTAYRASHQPDVVGAAIHPVSSAGGRARCLASRRTASSDTNRCIG